MFKKLWKILNFFFEKIEKNHKFFLKEKKTGKIIEKWSIVLVYTYLWYIANTLVTQPMLQRQPNRTVLSSMDSNYLKYRYFCQILVFCKNLELNSTNIRQKYLYLQGV